MFGFHTIDSSNLYVFKRLRYLLANVMGWICECLWNGRASVYYYYYY